MERRISESQMRAFMDTHETEIASTYASTGGGYMTRLVLAGNLHGNFRVTLGDKIIYSGSQPFHAMLEYNEILEKQDA